MKKITKLNWEGVEAITTDPYYDISNGYYTDEIEDEETRIKLKEAISVIESLIEYLNKNDLVG